MRQGIKGNSKYFTPYFPSFCSFMSPAITLMATTLDLNAIDNPKLLQQVQSDQSLIPHATTSPTFQGGLWVLTFFTTKQLFQFPNPLRLEPCSAAFWPPLTLFWPWPLPLLSLDLFKTVSLSLDLFKISLSLNCPSCHLIRHSTCVEHLCDFF